MINHCIKSLSYLIHPDLCTLNSSLPDGFSWEDELLLWWWRWWWMLGCTPQVVHDQRAQNHGQVGAADAHLAAEEEGRQRPGHVLAQRQVGALLENSTWKGSGVGVGGSSIKNQLTVKSLECNN